MSAAVLLRGRACSAVLLSGLAVMLAVPVGALLSRHAAVVPLRRAALRRVDPAALASECQRKFACSTTVEDLPGKNNPGQAVILQVIRSLGEGGCLGLCVCACWTRRRLTFVLSCLPGRAPGRRSCRTT